MKVITYRVTLLEPTLVTSLQGDPNSAVAFDYLPGSVLRGMVIGKYLGVTSTDASDSTFQRLFLDGTTRYLNGYPLDEDDQPGLPVPLSWHQAKHGKKGEIFDFAVDISEKGEQWQTVSGPFYTQSGTDVELIRPARNVAVHTQRTARFGRAMPRKRENDQARGQTTEPLLNDDEIIGAVYRYDALAARQSFQAAIICDQDADASTLLPFLEGRVSLGGSRSGGYGQAKISHVQESDADSAEDVLDERENFSEEDEDAQEKRLIVTFQSDVLIRDKRGQYAVDPELLRQILNRHLQVNLVPKDAFLGAQIVGGFNRTWRLPLPQVLSVRMGSVLVFEDPGCDPLVLKALERRGIGERRAEGFGRLMFNWQREGELTVINPLRSNDKPERFTINDAEASSLAALMTRRMLKQRLDEGLLAVANAVQIANPPSNAQLSRLRSIVLEELRHTPPNTHTIGQFLKGIEQRGSARRQFERSTITRKGFSTPLLRWLKDLLQVEGAGAWTMKDDTWRELLDLDTTRMRVQIDALEIGGVKAERDDTLRLEYVLRLIDLVLAHAAKRRGEEN
ncbi:MAG TPA: hypothetical protein VFV38_43815 [Ktedonobacteraceae bacterium]|nr:hypothetical protein [Ktedonobacteraceae bacterium]